MGRKPVYVAAQMLLFDNDLLTATSEMAPIGSARYVEPDKDGITPERFEEIIVQVPKNARCNLKITVAQGNSGIWYFGRHIRVGDNSNGYGPWPKFSDKFGSREVCIAAAADNISQYLEKEKSLKPQALKAVKQALCELHPEEPKIDREPDEEAESNRRESICRNWRLCEHKDICFTPQNEEAGICFAEEPHRIPAEHRPLFSRDQLKVLAAGFRLVRYTRDEKKVEISGWDPADGWNTLEPFATYAAAERKVNELRNDYHIFETGLDGKIAMSGWNRPAGLGKSGFEFYRCYGLHRRETSFSIKIGSKNWSNLAKYPDAAALKAAWDELMKDKKALEG